MRKPRSLGNTNGCAFIEKLKWKTSGGGNIAPGARFRYAPIGKARAKTLVESFGLSTRLPKPGYELILGECGEATIALQNRAGKFTVERY